MELNYKITAFDSNGTITIVAWHSDQPSQVYTIGIEVPVVDGKYATGTDLDAIISVRLPAKFFQRKLDVATATNADDINKLINIDATITV